MLGPLDALPVTPRRIAVAGVSGAGKSTLARRLSQILQLPYTEIDSLFHGPNWTERDEFASEVDAVTRGDRWVIEWQYTSQKTLIAERADTLVWLDLPYRTVLRQVTGRTLRRRFSHEPLWNGNVEGPLLDFFTDPDQIIRWSIRSRNALDGLAAEIDADHPHLQVIRLTSHREIEQFVVAAAQHRGQ